jgi:chaperone required for assembly of F1-ATPase
MKRFYARAAVVPTDEGFTIALDDKTVRTPAGHVLAVQPAELAEAIAEEWLAQGEAIRPDSMPLCQLASTALDRVIPHRRLIVEQLLNYAKTDLLCYWAEAPQDLVERQKRLWQPMVDWAMARFAVDVRVTRGVIPVVQPETTLAVLEEVLAGYDHLRLTALQSAVAAMGSLLLGLALIEERLSPEEAFAVSQLDETYQIELWGEDAEAARSREALRKDIAAAARFLELSIRKGIHLSH